MKMFTHEFQILQHNFTAEDPMKIFNVAFFNIFCLFTRSENHIYLTLGKAIYFVDVKL